MKSIDLAILFTVYLIQEIVLQVSLYNKRNAKGFVFAVFLKWKSFEKNTVPMRQILIKEAKKINVLFILTEVLWELKDSAAFRCFLVFSLFPKKQN